MPVGDVPWRGRLAAGQEPVSVLPCVQDGWLGFHAGQQLVHLLRLGAVLRKCGLQEGQGGRHQ